VVREELVKKRRRARILWTTLGIVVVLATGGLVGWHIYRAQKPPSYAKPAHLSDYGGPGGGLLAADQGGAVPVEVYLDFGCPACKQFVVTMTPTLNQLLAEKKIKLVWHPLTYDNSMSTPPGYSTRAASAAGCAADAGKLKAYGEALFTVQPAQGGPGLSDDELIVIGGPLGLNAPSFAQCVRAVKYTEWVTHVNELATQRSVVDTPTILVAGKTLQAPTAAAITAAVAASI
jgi:protein-disulfide isomerase